MNKKPLGHKAYGSIPHLPNSRIGPGDHKVTIGQAKIATEKIRDKHDKVYCTRKLDGSNCCVAKINDTIIPLTRAGYPANTSPYKQHHVFNNWVFTNYNRFDELLKNNERVCGEWLAQVHGTRYQLWHEPFVVFDFFIRKDRLIFTEIIEKIIKFDFIIPDVLGTEPTSVKKVLQLLENKYHGEIDDPEGAVWRIERNEKVDFLCKFVRPNKKDGIYLPEISGKPAIWNWKE